MRKIFDISPLSRRQILLKSLQWNEDLISGNVRSIDVLIERTFPEISSWVPAARMSQVAKTLAAHSVTRYR
jgi:hypothetical protein